MSEVLDLDVITAEGLFTEDHWLARFHDYKPGGRKYTNEHARTRVLAEFLGVTSHDFQDVSTRWATNKLYFRTGSHEHMDAEKLTTLMGSRIKMDGREWVFSSIGADCSTICYPYEEPYSSSYLEFWWEPAT